MSIVHVDGCWDNESWVLLNCNEAVGHCSRTPLNEQSPPFFMPGVQHPGSRTYFRSGYCEWSVSGGVQHCAVPCRAYPCGWRGAALWHFGAKRWWAESRVTRSTRWQEYLFSSASPGLVIWLGITWEPEQTGKKNQFCLLYSLSSFSHLHTPAVMFTSVMKGPENMLSISNGPNRSKANHMVHSLVLGFMNPRPSSVSATVRGEITNHDLILGGLDEQNTRFSSPNTGTHLEGVWALQAWRRRPLSPST